MTDAATATLTFTVGEGDTAAALGSGDLPVLGTPRLVAWAEAATCAAVADALTAEQTSVGMRVELDHRAPSAVGADIEVTATELERQGRRISFEVSAKDASRGTPLARGLVTRAVVEREDFLARGSSDASGVLE